MAQKNSDTTAEEKLNIKIEALKKFRFSEEEYEELADLDTKDHSGAYDIPLKLVGGEIEMQNPNWLPNTTYVDYSDDVVAVPTLTGREDYALVVEQVDSVVNGTIDKLERRKSMLRGR